MRVFLAITLLTVATVGFTVAQEASECEGALGGLRSKLEKVQQQLAAAEASGSSCTQEAAALKEKLAAAAGASSSEQDKLHAAVKEAEASLAATERQLSEAAGKLAASEKEVAALQAAVQDSKSAAAGCATAKGEVEAKLQAAHKEAAATLRSAESVQTASAAEVQKLRQEMDRVRAEAAAAKAQLVELEKHHNTSWLPHWAGEASRVARQNVGPALQQAQELAKQYTAQGSKAAQGLWSSHAKPAVERGLAFAKEKSGQLNAAIEGHAGASWPKLQAALGSAGAHAASAAGAARKAAVAGAAAAHKRALQAWQSDAVAAVRPTLEAMAHKAAATVRQVQAELETLLISLLAKSNSTAPLARRPYVTWMVYGALLVPLVTFGMPLLGLRRSGPRARVGESSLSGGSSVPRSTKKKQKPAGGR